MSRKSVYLFASTVLLAGLMTLLAGCAYPSVSLETAKLRNVQLSGLTVDVFFEVHNPNQFALPLEQVDWTMSLFGAHVGGGVARMNKTIPAQQTTRVKMPIKVAFGSVQTVATNLSRSRSISWDLDGTAQFQAPTGPISLDFADGGRWDNPMR